MSGWEGRLEGADFYGTQKIERAVLSGLLLFFSLYPRYDELLLLSGPIVGSVPFLCWRILHWEALGGVRALIPPFSQKGELMTEFNQ